MIKSVKVWKDTMKRECRIYVHTDDGRQGCKYITGNPWHPKGSIEGTLTAADWAEARKIAVWDGAWHTVYENEMTVSHPEPFGESDVKADAREARRPGPVQFIDPME